MMKHNSVTRLAAQNEQTWRLALEEALISPPFRVGVYRMLARIGRVAEITNIYIEL